MPTPRRRLLHRPRTVRVLLITDLPLGIIMALLVLAQAVRAPLGWPHARSTARRSRRSASPCSSSSLSSRRGALAAWGSRSPAGVAAVDMIVEAPARLVEARLQRRPTTLNGASERQGTTATVSGVDALETTFRRFLPQVVRSHRRCSRPCFVLVASINLARGRRSCFLACRSYPRWSGADAASVQRAAPRAGSTQQALTLPLDPLPRRDSPACHAARVRALASGQANRSSR